MTRTSRHPTRTRRLSLPAHPSAVPWARRLLCQTLRGWGLDGLADPAQLLVSELVTNAVKAAGAASRRGGGPGGQAPVSLTLTLTDTCLELEVWDASPGSPVLREPGPTAECGRGLLIVDMLSSSWGQRPADGGKVVWCELGLPAAAGRVSGT
ncbi:MAG: ATP-binding protein [Gemmatimonadota bacterium]